jgi:neutral ceramidase
MNHVRQSALLMSWLPALLLGRADAAPFFAGAARQSITPPPDIGHVSLGGYGDRQGAPYEGVHDEILARALALRSGDTTCVIVALDRLEVPRFLHEDVCPALAEEAVALPDDFPVGPGNLILTASHTHSAPENMSRHGDVFPLAFGRYNERLYRWTLTQIVTAVKRAIASLQPASVGSAQVWLEGLSANRRGDGTTDPVLTVLSFVSEEGECLAVLANFTVHPTMLGADNLLISGEWPGVAERLVEEELGGEAVCLFINGALGDQRPAGDFGAGFERVERYGRRMADEILAARERAATTSQPILSVAAKQVVLPDRQPSPAFVESAQEEYPIPAEMMKAALEALFPERAWLQTVRIGDAMLVTVPGEMIASLGMELKGTAAQHGVRHPFIAGLANTYCGYILTPAEYDEGGYEAAVSVYGRDFGPWLLGELSGLIAGAAQ